MKTRNSATAAVLALTFAACGSESTGTSPTAAVGTTNPTPAPTATPVPTPEPTPVASPTPEPPAEEPVTRTTKVTRLTLRLFVVLDASGQLTDYEMNDDGQPIIPLGYQFRLDVVPKDAKNKETIGSGEVVWHFKDESSIEVYNFVNVFHPRLRAARAGTFTAQAELDGVESNPLTLEFRN